jgi:hypothetical protein
VDQSSGCRRPKRPVGGKGQVANVVDALVGGALSITLPEPLPGFTPTNVAAYTPANDYVVLARAANAVTVTKVESDEDGDTNNDHLAGFDLAGTGTDLVDWVVIKVGH